MVLGYIQNDAKRFKVYVANRVQQIRDHSTPTQWHHVKTAENPADVASRGLNADDLVKNSDWTTGPAFLWHDEIPIVSSDEIVSTLSNDDPEIKRVNTLATHGTLNVSEFESDRVSYFSNWFKAKRAVANCLKLKSKLQARYLQRIDSDYTTVADMKLTPSDLKNAETEIIKSVQSEAFEDELIVLGDTKKVKTIKKSSPLYKLDPFLDKDGILRVGGRVKNADVPFEIKHPVLLPRKHHVVQLIIGYFHERVQHQGRGITTNEIRANGFWIIGLSSAVSYYIRNCVKCRKLRSKPQMQKMADLPEDRVTDDPPFTFCGVDYFGPWYVKEGRKTLKRYGVLFTCMASRAVHIEVSNSLSTDSFINALRRFVAVRGPISQLRSDQGTNFVGAKNELKNALSEMDKDKVSQFLLNNGCDFEFRMNVPHASHMGGAWERQIRTVRNILASLFNDHAEQLDDESLRTFMCEVMMIINSRPLTNSNLNDPLSLEPLTPYYLLTLKSKVVFSPPGEFKDPDLYSRKRWRRVQYLANLFWNRWKREYLSNLQIRQKWVKPEVNVDIDDIVLIVDDNLHRNEWRLARVTDVNHGKDNRVRSVKLIVGDSNLNKYGKRVNSVTVLERPIHKLVIIVKH